MASETIPQIRPIVTLAEARRSGLKRYFTGHPCKRGHIAERLTSTRVCRACSQERDRQWREQFPEKARDRFRGWAARYPEKAKAKDKSWRSRNQDKVRNYGRKSYHSDIEKSRQRQRENRRADPAAFKNYAQRTYKKHKLRRILAVRKRYLEKREEILLVNAKWRKKNPDRVRAIGRKWAALNPDVQRAWRDANPDKVRIYLSVSSARRRSRIKKHGGTFTRNDIDRIFKQQKGKCAYCRISLKAAYHIDHIKPLAKGGTNHPSNIQLCCAKCNWSKNARDPLEFARSMERLL